MVTWFAGLFYLPRLFVYHAMTDEPSGRERFKLMERKLYYGIMMPGALLTIIFGLWLMLAYTGWDATWLRIELALVLVVIGYHLYCGKLLNDFKHDRNSQGHVWYRVFNEIPVLLLIAIVVLAVVKPFS